MRFITNLLPSINPLASNEEVKGLARTPMIEPRYQQALNTLNQLEQYQQQVINSQSNDAQPQEDRRGFGEDRRKMNQRFRKDPVLVELRSGRDRRRRHLRATDIVERIDIKA